MTSTQWLLFILSCFIIHINGICNNQTGPVGSIECSSVTHYTKKQWITCVTNSYIQLQSQGRIKCLNEKDNYCTHSCMSELYYINEGNVADTCVCNDSLIPPSSSLPTECFSPDGSVCDWYKTCLQRQYACTDTSTEYLYIYTTLFCNLSIKYQNIFTDRAQRWINDGRRCIQVSLVPYIRPFINGSCQIIHDVAMDVFKSCHIRPFPGQGSICAITRRDWLRAFWMMKSEYQLSVSTAAYVWLQDMLDTFYECQKDIETDDFTHIYREFKLSIDLIQTSWDNLNKNQLNQMAIDITHRIAKFLMASSEQWSWYAYGIPLLRQRSNIEYEQITIVLSIVDLHGIVNDTLIPPVNITNIEFESLIEKFKNALKKGDLKIQNDNGTFYVSQISHCMDMKCHATTETIFAPSYSTTSSANHRCLSIFFLVFLTLTICIDRF